MEARPENPPSQDASTAIVRSDSCLEHATTNVALALTPGSIEEESFLTIVNGVHRLPHVIKSVCADHLSRAKEYTQQFIEMNAVEGRIKGRLYSVLPGSCLKSAWTLTTGYMRDEDKDRADLGPVIEQMVCIGYDRNETAYYEPAELRMLPGFFQALKKRNDEFLRSAVVTRRDQGELARDIEGEVPLVLRNRNNFLLFGSSTETVVRAGFSFHERAVSKYDQPLPFLLSELTNEDAAGLIGLIFDAAEAFDQSMKRLAACFSGLEKGEAAISPRTHIQLNRVNQCLKGLTSQDKMARAKWSMELVQALDILEEALNEEIIVPVKGLSGPWGNYFYRSTSEFSLLYDAGFHHSGEGNYIKPVEGAENAAPRSWLDRILRR